MFDKNYYCLVAGLREYSLDADTKGFNARAIIEEILEGVSARDARCVRLLYGYYDCENLGNFRKGRAAHNPLGNLSREEIEEQTKNPDRLPARMATVVRSYSAIVDEDADNEDGIDTDRSFENALFSAYYDECAHSKSRFLRQWADFDRNLRNISAAVVARVTGRSAEQSVVGGDETSQQLKRSSAADFGLRGDVPYLEAVIAAVNDETNLVEKERKIDAIRWNQAEELSTFDYFDINALLAYLVKVNIVARWTRLDDKQGREMLHRLMTSLDGKDLINKQ